MGPPEASAAAGAVLELPLVELVLTVVAMVALHLLLVLQILVVAEEVAGAYRMALEPTAVLVSLLLGGSHERSICRTNS
jgi:hypothetical protein